MRKPSEVIGESLTWLESLNHPDSTRWFMCPIIYQYFPKAEAEEACTLIANAIHPYNSLSAMLCNTADDYPCFDESEAFEYRYQWWVRFIQNLEAEGL